MNWMHTPGPWKASPFSSVVGCPITAQPDPRQNTVVIAGVHGSFGDDYRAEVEANARLIALAPQMLEMLVDGIRHMPIAERGEWRQRAQAVIDKAARP